MSILNKKKDKHPTIIDTDSYSIHAEANAFSIQTGVFTLTEQVTKDFDALLKQEANITHGLSELLGGSEYTTGIVS